MRADFPLRIVRDRQMTCVPQHTHTFTELAFVAEGSALHSHTDLKGKTRYEGLIPGDLFSVLPGESHEFHQGRSLVLYNIYLHEQLLAPYVQPFRLPGWSRLFHRTTARTESIHLSVADRIFASQCLDRAIREERNRQDGYEAVMIALLLEFLIPAIRNPDYWIQPLDGGSSGVLESVSMMEESPERQFTLGELAHVSNMSVASYTAKFREATGMSPMSYLLKVRLQQARHYLRDGDRSIEEIARKCGFCTPNYLIKIFRRETGRTPGQWRREQQG